MATIIRSTGWWLWGNRTWSPDPAWPFLFTVRVADRLGGKIVDALQAFERDLWLVLKNEVWPALKDISGVIGDILKLANKVAEALGGWGNVIKGVAYLGKR